MGEKVLVIGDPHGYSNYSPKIFDGVDFTIITGDLGKADLARKRFFENIKRKQEGLSELEEDKKFVKEVYNEIHYSTLDVLKTISKYVPTYTLQGNVGIPSRSDRKLIGKEEKYNLKIPRTLDYIKKMKNVYLVKNQIRDIQGLRVGFLEHFTDVNWMKEFNSKDKDRMKRAKKGTAKAKNILRRFGKGLDLLVSHQPPYGYLDKVSGKFGAPRSWWGKHAGSKVLLDYIKKYSPPKVVCGHIHEGKGHVKIGKSELYNVGFNGDYIILDF